MGLMPAYILTVSAICIVVSAVMYAKYRWGLATRMFTILLPIMAFCGGCGIHIGLNPTVETMLVVVGGAAPVAIASLYLVFRIVVKRLDVQVSGLLSSTSQISATARQSSATASQQAATVAEISSTIEEIHQTSTVAAGTAQAVVTVTSQALDKGQQGIRAVADAMKVMELIVQVSEIVETVNDLAEQSNLLAVNASIEAAKAGEQGRGFAVVASEVRSLAEQSKRATQQIRNTLLRAEEGRRTIESVNTIIVELAGVLDESSDRARQIAGAAAQQAAGIKQIAAAMSSVSQGGRDTANGASQLEQAVGNLGVISSDLKKLISG